jgi:gliding motility-associated-like protein
LLERQFNLNLPVLKIYNIALILTLLVCSNIFAQGHQTITYADSLDVAPIPRTINVCDSDHFVIDPSQPRLLSLNYSTDNPAVLQFFNGKLHPVAVGTAIIYLSYSWIPTATYSAVPGHVPYGSVSVTVTVLPPVIPDIRVDTNFTRSCDGATLTYQAISDANPGSTYQWQVNGTSADTGLNFSSNMLHNGDILRVTVTMNNKCQTLNSASLIVKTTPPSVKINPRVMGPACIGSSVSIVATTANMGSITAWQWHVNGVNSGISNSTFTSSNLQNGDVVDCQVTYKNDQGCTITYVAQSPPLTISVKPVLGPVITIAPSENPICSSVPITFTATAADNTSIPVYQWLVNGKNAGANSTVFTSTFKNNDMVTCMVTTSECTVPSISQPVVMSVYTTPVIKLNKSISVLAGKSVQLEPVIEGNIAKYSWMPSVELSSSTVADPLVTPTQNTTYTLSVVSVDGCQAEATVTVNVIVSIVAPSVFTPNGDGINDSWHIPSLAYFPHCLVSVYNRNGAMVFHSNGYNIDWDGNYNGKPLQVGTYYYIIEAESKGTKVSGTVTIIR